MSRVCVRAVLTLKSWQWPREGTARGLPEDHRAQGSQ